ncbi:MAG: peptidoglycan DD-metalloendopeptidase family protein [Rhodobacteraceae bacterium]|nr:peptidoglycan DD-metalloendopeptidase family protein [Paracoccaceae bacterium]
MISLIALLPSQLLAEKLKIVLPSEAPPIISDYKSRFGVNNLPRRSRHQGMDIGGPAGMEIIAIAPGKVVETDIGDCWGPTVVIDHGRDPSGKPLIAAYGHVGDIVVRTGQNVKRGQLIARLGDNAKDFRCIWGVRHLHLQLGRQHRSGPKGTYWGHVKYLTDGKKGLNPHLYWADGPGKVTCFQPGKRYPAGTITYPTPCR